MKITILKKGKKEEGQNKVIASGSIVLIQGKYNTIVDTGFENEAEFIVKALKHYGLTPDDIDYVINTHLHPDHTYNNHLFKNCEFIIGVGVYKNHEVRFLTPDKLKNYIEDYEIILTPGHGEMPISILVKGKRNYAIVGDIIGSEEDVKNIFNGAKRAHGNFDVLVESRKKVVEFADVIISGHCEPIEVKKEKSTKIKAIIFDNGGVLVSSGIFTTLKEWEKMFNIPVEKLKEIIFEKHYISYRAGKITEKQFWESVIKEVKTDIDWSILKTMWLSSYVPKQDTLDFVQEVKNAGYKIAYVSDSPLEFAEYIEARYGLPDLFPHRVVSCYDDCIKREIKAFSLILDRLGTRPDETVLLDDEESNIEMAKSLGLHAIRFESVEQAKKELEKLGVKLDEKKSLVKCFNELNREDVDIAGGKGASLGEMYNAGFPVPDGFVVTADAFRYFIENNNLEQEIKSKLENLNVEDTNKLRKTADKIQNLIKNAEIPEKLKEEIKKNYSDDYVAVRSSATAEDLPDASFAGQQATFLNIKGKENVVNAVKDCFASLFTARAIYYREKNGFDHMKVALAAVIQKMVDSKKSGVIFSVNPITKKKNEMIIEGAFGLGESVVGGELTPDSFIVNKNNMDIQKKITKQTWGYFRENGKTEKKQIDYGENEVLTEKEIEQLVKLTKKIESHYGCPQDIEWAIDDKVYIVQSRPITTLK